MYFLVTAAWLNVLLAIGFSFWIRMAVGVVALGARYARASRLVGGVVLAAVGLMLLFRPQWLVFH